MRSRKWIIKENDINLIYEIKKKFNLKESIANLISKRGFKNISEVDDFLNPVLNRLPNPNLLKDLKKGGERVAKAIINQEKLAIYGDYDADGVTACALVYIFLKEIGADVAYYIPDRFEDGYSLSKKAIEELKEKGVKVIITVDCGVSDLELVNYGNELGLEFIITDHHNVPKNLPNAYAVINPKRVDCSFPFKELAGVGVAFYFLMKLRKILREFGFFANVKEPNLKSYLDLVAIGTVSDMVPLLGPNRIFVKYGLEEIKKNQRIGLKALLTDLNIDDINPRLISFRITPRLNAPGRMSHPKHAFELLVSSTEDKAKELVKTLNSENQRRQKEEEKVIQSVLKIIDSENEKLVHVHYSPDWHPGVLGIVASKLVEKYQKPFFIFTDEENGFVRGSGRSIDGFPLSDVMEMLADVFIEFGGHDMACGITMNRKDLGYFSDKINEVAKKFLLNQNACNICNIDVSLDVSDIDDKFFEDLSLLEPFGKGNPEPSFLIDEVIVERARPVGQKENHLKLLLKKDNFYFNSIGFFMFTDILKEKSKIDVVGIPKVNMYNNIKSWDFLLKDFCILD